MEAEYTSPNESSLGSNELHGRSEPSVQQKDKYSTLLDDSDDDISETRYNTLFSSEDDVRPFTYNGDEIDMNIESEAVASDAGIVRFDRTLCQGEEYRRPEVSVITSVLHAPSIKKNEDPLSTAYTRNRHHDRSFDLEDDTGRHSNIAHGQYAVNQDANGTLIGVCDTFCLYVDRNQSHLKFSSYNLGDEPQNYFRSIQVKTTPQKNHVALWAKDGVCAFCFVTDSKLYFLSTSLHEAYLKGLIDRDMLEVPFEYAIDNIGRIFMSREYLAIHLMVDDKKIVVLYNIDSTLSLNTRIEFETNVELFYMHPESSCIVCYTGDGKLHIFSPLFSTELILPPILGYTGDWSIPKTYKSMSYHTQELYKTEFPAASVGAEAAERMRASHANTQNIMSGPIDGVVCNIVGTSIVVLYQATMYKIITDPTQLSYQPGERVEYVCERVNRAIPGYPRINTIQFLSHCMYYITAKGELKLHNMFARETMDISNNMGSIDAMCISESTMATRPFVTMASMSDGRVEMRHLMSLDTAFSPNTSTAVPWSEEDIPRIRPMAKARRRLGGPKQPIESQEKPVDAEAEAAAAAAVQTQMNHLLH